MQYYLILSLIVVFLSWLFRNKSKMPKVVFLLSFAAIATFFAIRYGFGLDYWHYYNLFDTGRTSRLRGPEETLFYGFMNLFPKYYIFVIAHTIVLFISLAYVSFRVVAPKYYYVLFFMLLFNPDMILNMTSAMRSSMAACIIWIITYCFIIKNKNYLFYSIGVIVATGFHTSAILFLFLPWLLNLIGKFSGNVLLIVLFMLNILSMFFATFFYDFFVSYSKMDIYDSNTINNSTFNGAVFKLVLMPIAYYLCAKDVKLDINPRIRQISILFLALIFSNFDFQGRFTVYLYVFFVAAVCKLLSDTKGVRSFIIGTTIVLFLLYNFYTFVNLLASNVYAFEEGNFLIYETIFDVSSKP